MTNTMTMRDMLTAVIEGNITDEVIAKATSEIAKLDARNASRKAKPSKVQVENVKHIETIASLLTEEPKLASEIAELCGLSTSKVSALAPKIEGVKVSDVKVKGKGMRKAYSI